uniref:DENN/MADD domain containing 6Aa n=1 Tax=Callorhinchus milii TaxID=7868 RepID=A0A4W3KEV7_CALMI
MALRGLGDNEESAQDIDELLHGIIPLKDYAWSPDESPTLPWDRFSAWVHSICVVGFDLELGQAVEVIYPSHAKLSDKEKTSICYLSFPDSNSGNFADKHFSFWKLPDSIPGKDSAHYYGYVYFRQVRDKTLKRGYFQKSLVLISKLPYVNFFHSLLKLIAPEYFDKNEPCLEAACNDLDRWPAPISGKLLNLPIMGVVIKMLWELVLLGEPLVVMAPSPAESSETVLTLVCCILPLKYCSDFRPYFTIHDSEFKEYTTRTQAPPSVILGVTNPFFAKTLQHWPHIIRIGDMKPAGDIPKQVKVKKLKNLKTLDSKPVLTSICYPIVSSRKQLFSNPCLRTIPILLISLQGIQQKRPSEAQSAIIRRYFLELTQSFIIPLERYVASLMPLQKSISPWKSPPQLKPFIAEEFLKTLEKAGPQLTSRLKGDWIGLYRQFLKSPNFDGWFRLRWKEMTQKLSALHLEALCNAVSTTEGNKKLEYRHWEMKAGRNLKTKTRSLSVKECCKGFLIEHYSA